MLRTHHCGELRIEQVGHEVTLAGWVNTTRDHGGVVFIDLRDRSGLVQCVFHPEHSPQALAVAAAAHNEWVLQIRGNVRARPAGTENLKLPTGAVEIEATACEVLNACKPVPFPFDEDKEPDESVRLRYRYVDLRRKKMRDILELRHRAVKAVRDFLDAEGFWEIETPQLWKSTPEGAREFIVPVRSAPGKCFVLPQSPQICKQLLMVGGVEKYFQIARCFRDEDARADRQAEFTQIDMEMSFVEQDDVLDVVERLFSSVMKRVMNVEVPTPFPRMTYAEALARFGSDKPDTRFALELADVSDIATRVEFKVFKDTVANGGQVKCLAAPGCAAYSRKEVEVLTDIAKRFGAKGLATWAIGESEVKSAIAKFFTPEQMNEIFARCGAKPGDLVLAVADKAEVVAESLNRLRLELGKRLNLIPEGTYDFRWVVDFPMVEWNRAAQRYDAKHHPFCMPNPDDLPLLDAGFEAPNPGSAEHPHTRLRAWAYDLILNGNELGSGSIRCHRRELQERIFRLLGLTPEQAQRRFGFMLDAFEYGAPPHGGIAPGVDRFIAILAGVDPNIRDVIAFPKTANTTDLMTGAPTELDAGALDTLGLRVVATEADEVTT